MQKVCFDSSEQQLLSPLFWFCLDLCKVIHRNKNRRKMVVPSDPKREQVLKLIAEKDKIEKKIEELGLTLQQVS